MNLHVKDAEHSLHDTDTQVIHAIWISVIYALLGKMGHKEFIKSYN